MFSAEDRLVVQARKRLAVGTLAGLLGALACFAAAQATGVDLVVDARGDQTPVPVGAVVFASLLGGGAGWALMRMALRRSRPRRSFLVWTVVGLLLSALPPLQAATEWTTAAWLTGMHVAVWVGLVPVVAAALPVGTVPARAADPARADVAERAGP